ncbi:IS3 family transposase [Salinimicrobium sediminilitoris]|uniref:IS3 family transposase n=1 Tax=Salinimicrobium sediminilitoris TaxID=2876715 RepID=UPI001E6352A5|nr:IS3 family transposase [Salinimicrobium sediminilitoris]
MNQFYEGIGISKQTVHQYARRQTVFDHRLMQLMEEADDLREDHPGCGVEKMYYTLKPDFIGRDRFVDTFMQLGYRLKRKKNYSRTTIAGKIYYPNKIKGIEINAPSVIWQSDITYYRVGDKFYYAVFIIDVYTKKIVGYEVSDHMRGTANLKALKMALKDNKAPKIHHSDRGSQYTYKSYIDLLKSNTTTISMALSAQDNAYAERINRTIKEEYLDHWKPQTFTQLKSQVKKAVKNYNSKRSHGHLGKRNSEEFINYWLTLEPEERPVITIFDNEN